MNTNIGNGVADGVSRRQLFSLAAEHRLIPFVDSWMQHHHARNASSHIYDLEKAQFVYGSTGTFALDARQLLQELEERND